MKLLGVFILLFVTGCAGIPSKSDSCTTAFMKELGECIEEAEVVSLPASVRLANLPPAKVKPVVAVYAFKDLTGARKHRDNLADFSTAVTQGAEVFVIDALKSAGKGNWFRVVERNGLENLVKERQIIRSAREEFATNTDKKKLQPLLFAGIIIDGGIVGYDTNIESGGRGARFLGIGSSVQYRRDSLVVSLRATSTLTGEILLNVQTKKSILSVGGGYDVFRFVDMDTKLIEIEDGNSWNESVTYSTRAAIEEAVLELIYQGHDRGFWVIEDGHRHPHQHDGTNDIHSINGENEHDETK
jgi:curli production assembly/transport component CsgG